MTTSTAQQELESLEEMSREVCRPCGGDGVQYNYDSDELSWVCPDCNGSGLKWEGLSRECMCSVYHVTQDSKATCQHPLCQGSGRVPVSVAEARCWAEDWLVNHGIRVLITDEGISFGTRQYVGNYKYTQPKTFSALPLFAAMKEAE